MYYAADNLYGSPTDIGFSNTWRVWVFLTRESRNKWVKEKESGNKSVRSIIRKDIPLYVPPPSIKERFDGKCRCLDTYAPDYCTNHSDNDSGITAHATIVVDYPGSHAGLEKMGSI